MAKNAIFNKKKNQIKNIQRTLNHMITFKLLLPP